MDNIPQAGQQYRHFRGNTYTVIGIARHTETVELMVLYTNATQEVWARPLSSWQQPVDEHTERFTLIN